MNLNKKRDLVKLKLLLILIALSFAASKICTQPIPIDKKGLPLSFEEIWTKEFNQSLSSIEAILQSKDGYIWLGTNNGLYRYDGVRFKIFNSTNTPSMVSNVVNALAEDESGTIWIGTGKGLFFYKNDLISKYDIDERIKEIGISTLCIDNEKDLFIGTLQHGLIKISKENKITIYKGIIGNQTISYCYYHNGVLWIGDNEKGLVKFENNKFEFLAKRFPVFHDYFRSILIDKKGCLWVGTRENGLIRYKDDQIKLYKKKDGLTSERILSLAEDKDGCLWIGTGGGGLLKMINGKFQVFTTKNGLNLDAIRSILFDTEGSLWVGTSGGGLNKLKRNSIITYTMRDGLADNNIWSINQDKKDNIWIGTGNNGVNVITKNKIKSITKDNGLKSNNIRSILCDSKGRVWIGSNDSGVIVIDGNQKTYYNTKNGLDDNHVRSLFEDSKNRIWIGTNNGLHFFSNDKLNSMIIDGKERKMATRNIAEDNDGNLWFANGSSGIFEYTGNKIIQYTKNDGLSSNDIVAFHFDKDNTLWIATGNGLNRFRNGKFQKIAFGNIFDNQLILNVLEDNYRNLWLSSLAGLLCSNIDEMDSFTGGKGAIVKSRIFGKEDGMLSTECNGANQNSGAKTRDGRLWFPTMNGLVAVDPGILFKTDGLKAPNVVLDCFVVDDSIYNQYSNDITIEPGSHKYEFHYAALSYKNPEQNKYKYRLDGIDTSWIEEGNRADAYYTNLPPGDYVFHVIASNADGVWNFAGKTLAFRVKPHFYETGLFISFFSLFILTAILVIYRWRINSLKEAKINLQKIVNEQTKLLKEELIERKNNETKLKDSEERLNFFIEGSKDAFWDWDLSQDKLSFNSKATDIFGCKFDELPQKGSDWDEKIHPEYKTRVMDLMDRYLEDKRGHFEVEYKLMNGSDSFKWVFDRGKIVEWDETGKPLRMAGSITDITERKKNEEEIMKVKKIESIGLLAGGIAHDFNNLLTAILGNISLIRIKLEKNDNKNLFKLLENSETASMRAKDLTQQLLTFSKGGLPIIKTISIAKLIEECAVFTLRGSKIKSHFDIKPDLWLIDADEGQINQVIQNLVMNALQAMPEGGNIIISAQNVRIDERNTKIYQLPQGDFVKISIEDNGTGIPKENFDKIFDPYFTTKEKGHGLGLSTSYSIIKKHNGQITVESGGISGTVFNVWIPKSKNDQSVYKQDCHKVVHGHGKILIMDDEELIRNLLEEILFDLGYEVDTSTDGEEAISLFKEALDEQSNYDLVILDLTVPGKMGGLETVKHILEIDPGTKAIVTSGYSNDPIMSDFRNYGFTGIITKPYKIEEISTIIYTVLDKQK
jgi:PAS domain S-box-containing protein